MGAQRTEPGYKFKKKAMMGWVQIKGEKGLFF